MAKATLSTEEVFAALQKRVLGPEGQGHRAFLFPEVQIEGRRADAMSMDLWHSRGHQIQGFEIKVSREDWLRELHHPEKAEGTIALCDHFWLVTNPGVLHPNELPEKWGLLLTNGRRRHLAVEKEAPKLKPIAPTHEFVVSMLRRIKAEADDNLHERYEDGKKKGEEDAGYMRERDEDEITRALGRVESWEKRAEDFREAAGIDFWMIRREDFAFAGKIIGALREGESGMKRLAAEIRRVEAVSNDLGGKLNDALAILNDHIFGKGQAA